MRIPAAIYPFSAEFLPAVKYFERLQDRYTLTKLISLPGFGLGGKDAAYACNPVSYTHLTLPTILLV